MGISFDPAKRARTLAERGLDFADAAEVFAGTTAEAESTREEYGETRIICWLIARPPSPDRLHAAWRGSPHH